MKFDVGRLGRLLRPAHERQAFDAAEALMDRIDFAALRDIAAAELRKSGGDTRHSERIRRENFSLRRRTGASTWPIFQKVTVGAADHYTIEGMLWTICHEAAHLVTSNRPGAVGLENVFGGFMLFNEGMTDHIARDMYEAYVCSKEPALTLSQSRARWNTYGAGTYKIGGLLVETVIDGLSQRMGVDRDEIYRSFKQHYFSGGFDGDVRRVFDAAFGSGFFRRLRALRYEEEDGGRVARLFERYMAESVPESTWSDLGHFIRYYERH